MALFSNWMSARNGTRLTLEFQGVMINSLKFYEKHGDGRILERKQVNFIISRWLVHMHAPQLHSTCSTKGQSMKHLLTANL